jgi:transcriptional regulator with XRE-family HTH domain
MKNRLKELRERAGFTQQTLGDAVGCSNQMISAMEGGTTTPSEKLLGKIAGALGVEPGEIFPDGSRGTPAMRKVILPEGTAKRAEEVLAREGYEDLNDLVADAVRRLVEGAEERIIQLRSLRKTNGGSAPNA